MSIAERPFTAELPAGGDPPLPRARGPRSEHLLAHLARRVHDVGPLPPGTDDPLAGEDAALALHVLYELHYRGFAGVDEAWEWEPSLLAARRDLEREFEVALLDAVGPVPVGLDRDQALAELDRLASADGGPSLSAHLELDGDLEQLRELAVHRAPYQLKEADPHTFGIPRLSGRAKAAMVEIQRGEYGNGQADDVHATLFASTMRALGLDDAYGAHLDLVPAPSLATGNLISLFGLHRRWRGALAGHLALFEMCSVVPMGRYASALRRLGFGDDATRFYDEHVVADEWHQVVGRDELAGGLIDAEPLLAGEVVFGARALTEVERRFSTHVLASWRAGHTSLLAALPG